MISSENRRLSEDALACDWWSGLDAAVLECLDQGGSMAPAEIGRRLGVSEASAASILSLLACQGRVRVLAVELAKGRES